MPHVIEAWDLAHRSRLEEIAPSVDYLGLIVGLAERTLHRRLDEEGLTFGELHDKMRHNLAEKYIRDPRLTVKQVAFLLGYNDQSAFGTAYRRWTGQTPGEARVQA